MNQRLKSLSYAVFGERWSGRVSRGVYHLLYVNQKRLTRTNSDLRGVYAGKRCFIIANGPSIKNQNLSLMSRDYVFTVNNFAASPRFKDVKPNCHIISDERLLNNANHDDPNDVINRAVHALGKYGVEHLFLGDWGIRYVEEYPELSSIDVRYISQCGFFAPGEDIRIDRVIPNFGTVVHSAICIAAYMGFSTIILVGCDCTGFVTLAKVHEGTDFSSQYGTAMSDSERKLVYANMTSRSIAEELRSYAGVFEGYEQLGEYCRTNGIMLLNATNGGILECVPRVDYLSLFSDTTV